MGPSALAFRLGLPIAVFASVILAPNPEGLTDQGQRALAVMGVAVVLWATETLHIAVTGMVGIVLLVLVDAVDDVEGALYGFPSPSPIFCWASLHSDWQSIVLDWPNGWRCTSSGWPGEAPSCCISRCWPPSSV